MPSGRILINVYTVTIGDPTNPTNPTLSMEFDIYRQQENPK
jgi:hypothetical protein